MIAAEFQLTGDDYTEALVNRRILHKGFVMGVILLGMILVLALIFLMDPAKEYILIPFWIFLGVNFLQIFLLRSSC